MMAASFGNQLPALWVLGTRFHAIQLEEALTVMERWVLHQDGSHYVVVTGMHGVMAARRDPAFRAILNQAGLFVPDGYSLVWLARRRGFLVKQRICGTDLLRRFCARAAQHGYRMFFYGDTEEVLARLTARLRQEFPSLQIVGSYSPPFRPLTPEEDERIVAMINTAKPDVLWVGLGLPKQERWIVEHQARLDAPVLVAIGAAFKFLSGTVPRAPRWMGEHGLEWIWRFAHEPRKLWRRALIDVPQFTWLALWELCGSVRSSTGRPSGVSEWTMGLKQAHRLKRPFDFFLACLGLGLSLPLWMLVAFLIKLEDGGPVFHAQGRVGKGGRRFNSWKFRSMVPDADTQYGPRQAGLNDHRVTRVGRMLRATAMDELPQLWNIARGDMSFVGPRALLPGEIEVNGDGSYVRLEEIPSYEARHSVRPGLTGLAQVRAPRDIPRHQKFRYDLLYIRHQGFWLDLRLIAVSCWISLRGKWESRGKKL